MTEKRSPEFEGWESIIEVAVVAEGSRPKTLVTGDCVAEPVCHCALETFFVFSFYSLGSSCLKDNHTTNKSEFYRYNKAEEG